jgi:hypothetical protein
LARIGVAAETAPHDWQAFKRLSGIPANEAGGLYAVAVGRCARPGEWYVIFEPVPRERWLAIEVWDGSAWVPHTD